MIWHSNRACFSRFATVPTKSLPIVVRHGLWCGGESFNSCEGCIVDGLYVTDSAKEIGRLTFGFVLSAECD